MSHIKVFIGGALLVAGLLAPSLAMAQDARLDLVRKAAPTGDYAAARADAAAKANNWATVDSNVDVRNSLDQKQAATGIGIGGKSSAVVKNQNVNVLKTGDIANINANQNKQIQSFGLPFVGGLGLQRP